MLIRHFKNPQERDWAGWQNMGRTENIATGQWGHCHGIQLQGSPSQPAGP